MKSKKLILILAAPLSVAFTLQLQAQLVADGDSLDLTTATNLLPGDLIVGTNGGDTSLTLTGPGGMVDDAMGELGLNASSSNNSVTVTGAGALWTNSGRLYVGEQGSGNQLRILDGGTVVNAISRLGDQSSSTNNHALVSGSGSRWLNNGNLNVGLSGSANFLTISNGGWVVVNGNGIIGSQSPGLDNQVVVTGSGSTWTNTGQLHIGELASGSQLRILDGGTVVNDISRIGDQSSSTNNHALVSGNGSLWLNQSNLNVGLSGSADSLTISNGGSVVVNGNGVIGSQWPGQDNQVVVTGPGSTWTNQDLQVGFSASGSSLTVTDAATTVVEGDLYIGQNAGSTHNRATLAGGNILVAGTTDVRRGTLTLNAGRFSTTHLLATNGPAGAIVFNGGTLVAAGGTLSKSLPLVVGENPGGAEAILDVRAGKPLVVSNQFMLGSNAANTRLYITNDGTFRVDGTSSIGFATNSTGNRAILSGAGSLWTNGGGLYIGGFGNGNQLVISNHAEVDDGFDGGYSAAVGSYSSSNSVLVTGRSLWINPWELDVGGFGSGNQLVISNGAEVDCYDYYVIGAGYSSSNNSVLVNNSYLEADGALYIGDSGSGNQLVISNGAQVYSYSYYDACVIGNGNSSSNNSVLVDNSYLEADYDLIIGSSGSGNQLVISNGAEVDCYVYAAIGYGDSSSNNSVLVTGYSTNYPSLLWLQGYELDVGYLGSGNQLVVSNGAAVLAGSVYIGPTAGSSNNVAILAGGDIGVDGTTDVRRGALWLDSGALTTHTLLATYGAEGAIHFNGGTLSVTNATVATGSPFVVGDGSSSATYQLLGNGLHTFADGLTVSANAALVGNGTIGGMVTVAPGGSLLPGNPIGRIVLSNSPSWSGHLALDISTNGAALTNDQIQVMAPLTYGGTLTVSNLGPTTLVAGDTFHLFNAQSYRGAFSGLTLPPLNPGLMWTNRLLLDGSIAVVPLTAPAIGGVTHSGANLSFHVTGGPPGGAYEFLTSTNLALPFSSWTTNRSGFFDWLGNVMITNGIHVGEPQRFFTISVP